MTQSETPTVAGRFDRSLNEAIPPAYTEYIGRQLIAHLRSDAPETP